jgi:hypothetical protein
MLSRQLHLDTADEQLAAKKLTADAAVREEVLKNVLGLIAAATAGSTASSVLQSDDRTWTVGSRQFDA